MTHIGINEEIIPDAKIDEEIARIREITGAWRE